MKIVHVIPHVDKEASGPSYSVPRLCEALAERGNSVELMCLAARSGIVGVQVEVHRQWPVLRRFAVSPAGAAALSRQARKVDVVHNHSLWSMMNVAAGWVVPGKRAILVTSPHGTLSPWALGRHKPGKHLLRRLQWRVLERADLLHATCDAEWQQIRALRLKAPVAVIPNGVDVPPLREPEPPDEWRTLLYLSRIHPTKRPDLLLRAWQELQHAHPDWRLVVAGDGETRHVQQIRSLARRLGLARVEFPGPLYGEAKSRAYRDADLFVLPTHSENFGMVVAEALAHACPVVVTEGAPWAGVVDEGCGWWVPNDAQAITAALDGAMREPRESLAAMGERGRRWMQRDYSWDTVAATMDAAYRWILGDGRCPTQVRQA